MNTILIVFLILALGYLLGSLKIKGLSLGSSGVLIVALIFGHFGAEIPSVIRNLGLALFVVSVGLIAGPIFFRNFKNKVYNYLILGVFIVLSGAVVTFGAGKLFDIPSSLSIGMFTGALTSTPGLAAAMEATGDAMASVGYGIAYPFGVVGVVLFVQLYPKIIHTDMEAEVEALHARLHGQPKETVTPNKPLLMLESTGLLVMSAVLTVGLLLGAAIIPLPGGMSFSLGIAGGPLFAGLIIGHFGRVGNVSLQVPEKTAKIMRELGLCLFLLGAGTEAGAGFVDVLLQYGWLLFAVGICITLLPMVAACLLARYAMKMDTLSTLGTVCGGMTSTPALGALISACKTEDVAAYYAAAYPFALICMVLFSQIMAMIW
jgi:putative transport protein